MKRFTVSAPVKMFVVWVGISAALMLVDGLGWLGFLRSGVERVLVPIEQVFYSASSAVRAPVESVRFWYIGSQRVADLERQVATLSVDAARVLQLEEENEAMRVMLGAPLPASWKFIPAPVIGTGEMFSIGAGEEQGVLVGDAVVWEETLLGVVTNVSGRKSSVRLLTDPETNISVYAPRTGAEGVVVGKFGSQAMVSQILQKKELEKGDVFLTSGAIGAPRGLVVGKVSEVISGESDLYKEAVLELPLDTGNLLTVFVAKEG